VLKHTNLLVFVIQTNTCLIDGDLNADWLFHFNLRKAARSFRIITNAGTLFQLWVVKVYLSFLPSRFYVTFHHAYSWRLLYHPLFIFCVTPDQLFSRLDHFHLLFLICSMQSSNFNFRSFNGFLVNPFRSGERKKLCVFKPLQWATTVEICLFTAIIR